MFSCQSIQDSESESLATTEPGDVEKEEVGESNGAPANSSSGAPVAPAPTPAEPVPAAPAPSALPAAAEAAEPVIADGGKGSSEDGALVKILHDIPNK